MRTSKMIKFLLVTFSLVTWAGYSSVNASEYLDGMDDTTQQNKILLSSAIHENESVQSMYSEGIAYTDTVEKIITVSSKKIHDTSGSMYSEGIICGDLKSYQLAKIRQKAVNSIPAAGHIAILEDK